MTPSTGPAVALFRAENRIFSRWLQRRPDLLRDGALGGPQSTYTIEPVRVLFVLKEPNDTGGRWSRTGADLRLETEAFARLRSTFPVTLLLAYLARHAADSPAPPFAAARAQLQDPSLRLQLLRSIALVNLKKTPGGAVCSDRSLISAVTGDGDLLRRQLALYRPHLTIAGGSIVHTLLARLTGQAVRPASTPHARPHFRDPGLGLCLSFFHPQATKGYEYLYTLLHQSLREYGLTLPPYPHLYNADRIAP